MSQQREAILRQARIRAISNATRFGWLHHQSNGFVIQCAVQLLDNTTNPVLPVDVTNLIDNISSTMLHSNVTSLIMASDVIYNQLACHYEEHNIHLDIMYNDVVVLSTTYPHQQPF